VIEGKLPQINKYNQQHVRLHITLPVAVQPIDLVLKDQQSVGKRSLHLMATVNAKRRWKTGLLVFQQFWKESNEVTCRADQQTSFLKINDINDN
jgi:hypothetical protein